MEQEKLRGLTWTHPIRVSDIYTSASLNAPEGYEHTGEFRIPLDNETYLSSWGQLARRRGSWEFDGPRLILRALPTIRSIYGTDSPEVPEGWEKTGEFRRLRQGDYYLDATGTWSQALQDSEDRIRLILRPTPKPKRLRVTRTLVMEGEEKWINSTLNHSRATYVPTEIANVTVRETDRKIEEI